MNEQDAIAKYIAIHGVSKCPTVCLNKTTATTNKNDRKILKRHQDKQTVLAEKRFKETFYRKILFMLIGFSFLPLFGLIEKFIN